MAEKEETGGHHVHWRKPRVTNPPEGQEVIAPSENGVLIIRSLRCQAAESGKLESGLIRFAARKPLEHVRAAFFSPSPQQ